jgi:uncharacterized membrane protein YeaQ/YmgE (transglycosylase-associated protein family)
MSFLSFIIIGLLVGEIGALFLERDKLISIRYVLTAIVAANVVGIIVTLLTNGVSHFYDLSNAAIIGAVLASGIAVVVLKVTGPKVNDDTDADIPWDDAS